MANPWVAKVTMNYPFAESAKAPNRLILSLATLFYNAKV
jgi:hypothetical protein